jgi:chorismate mutase
MSRAVRSYPTKEQLQAMPKSELDLYLTRLRAELEWRDGPVKKIIVKRLQVAENVLESKR